MTLRQEMLQAVRRARPALGASAGLVVQVLGSQMGPDGAFRPAAGEPAELPRLRAAKPMLRPYAAPNLCSGCHGFDGLRRYLYFHDPRRRAAPTP